MRDQGLLPDVVTYNALISACEKGTLSPGALQLSETILHQGLLPDGLTYNALISACGMAQDPKRACKVLAGTQH